MPAKPKAASPLDEARRKLRALGHERPYLNCLIGVPPETRALWTEVLALSRAAGGSSAALRLEGRALAFLGDAAAAAAVLDRAVAAEPGDREGLAWRAEARMMGGATAAAERDLGAAIALDPEWPWSRVLRAVCRLSAGDVNGAEADLRRALRSREAAPAAAGVYALLEGQRGAPKAGLARLQRAAGARPSAFVLGARAMLRRDAGDLPGSLEDFNRAAELEKSPWIYSQRADVLNRTGFFKEAVEDARRAGALLPDSAQPHAQAANIYFDQAQYPEAMAEMNLALEKAPDDAGLLARRARYFLVLSRLGEAEADLRRASALDPDNGQLRYESLLLAILLGGEDAALAALPRAGLSPAFADFLRGYVACRRKDFARAEKSFRSAASASEGGFAERAGFYALVARVLGEKGAPAPAPELDFYMLGIGINHPYQISVESLRALARCPVVYNNLGDPQVTEFLGLFGAEIRAVTRVPGEPASGRVERIVASLRRGTPSGFVTRIHPYIYRRIANDLVNACRREGLSFRATPSVSLTEVSWALGEAKGGGGPGAAAPHAARVFDIYFLTTHPALFETRTATVVYCIASQDERRALCAMLRERFPASHVVFILAGSGDNEREVEPVAVRGLEKRLLAVDLGAVLYVPALGEIMEKVIRICGLGTRPPEETTLETLQALESCRVVFCDVADEAVYSWLKGYCRKLSRPKSAAEVVAAAKKDGPVGLAVWGHPQFSSLLARRVQNEARKGGVPFTVAGAISPIGSAFARSVSFLGGDYGYQGIQGYELGTLLAEPGILSTELPLVVYAETAPAGEWRRLHDLLKSSYPAAHEVIVYPGSGGPERRLPVASLGDVRDEGAVMLVPPAAKAP